MIIFGRTRRGNLIGIAPDELGKVGGNDRFPKYLQNDENFDAWIVFDFSSVRCTRVNDERYLDYANSGLKYYAALYFKLRKSDDGCDLILKDKITLALKLVAPEFR